MSKVALRKVRKKPIKIYPHIPAKYAGVYGPPDSLRAPGYVTHYASEWPADDTVPAECFAELMRGLNKAEKTFQFACDTVRACRLSARA